MNARAAAVADLERRLGYAFKDRALLERALDPRQRRQAPRGCATTSGWSSSATGCWACWSPSAVARAIREAPEGRRCPSACTPWSAARPAPQVARRAGRRRRRCGWRRRETKARRPRQGLDPGRRLRGADRRASISTAGLRPRARLRSTFGPRRSTASPTRAAAEPEDRGCRSGRRRRAQPLPAYRGRRPRGARPRAAFHGRGRGRGPRAGAARGPARARRPKRPRRAPCWNVKASMSDAATRAGFAAVIGAPNAGKSTLVNRLVGSQGLDRHPEGPDHPLPGRAAWRSRARARSCWSTPPASSRPAAGSTAPWSRAAWSGRRGRRRRRPSGRRRGRARRRRGRRPRPPTGARPRTSERIVEGLKAAGRKAILALNKIDLVRRDQLLGAVAEAVRDRRLRRGLHDLGRRTAPASTT